VAFVCLRFATPNLFLCLALVFSFVVVVVAGHKRKKNLSVAAQQQAVMAKSSSIFAAKSAHMYTFASHTRD
jgi:hypothetical protein